MSKAAARFMVLALVAGCGSSTSSGYLLIHPAGVNTPRAQVQVMAFFLRPSAGAAGHDILETLGCTNRTVAERLSIVRAPVSFASAGALTVEAQGSAPFVVPVDPGSRTYGALVPPFFRPDQSVTVRFEGDDAPRFAHTLTAPPQIQWLEPACRNEFPALCPSFDRTRDLVVRWTPAAHGRVRVEMNGSGRHVACAFDARTGGAAVPQPLLPPGELSITVRSEAYAKVLAERSELHVELDAPAEERRFSAL